MKVEQQLRGSSVWNDAQLFPIGTWTMDTDLKCIRVHDGVTMGGITIPNQAMISLFGTQDFTAVNNFSVPGVLPNSVIGQMATFSILGNYTLPALTVPAIGTHIVLQANVAGVVILRSGIDLIRDLSADVTSLSLVQDQTVILTKKSTTRWAVMNRY